MLKKLRNSIANAFASWAKHDLIPQAKLQHPRRLLKQALSHYGIDLVIDVGANRGQFGLELIELGYEGKILSFEPTQETFNYLQSVSHKHPQWQCLETALGEEAGELTINRHSDDSLNSFLQTNALARDRYKDLNAATEKVTIERLDTVIARLQSKGHLKKDFRAFLKLDTQGFDLKVLTGASEIIGNVYIIQSEASVNAIYEGMPTYIETLSAIDKLGFKPGAFSTVSRDKNSLQFVEFDIIAIRSISA